MIYRNLLSAALGLIGGVNGERIRRIVKRFLRVKKLFGFEEKVGKSVEESGDDAKDMEEGKKKEDEEDKDRGLVDLG